MAHSRGARVAVPVAVVGLLVWFMVGCVYIPTWERTQLTGATRDFRPSARQSADMAQVYAVGRVTRAQVERILGVPPYRTADSSGAVYTLTTRLGLWVTPLCLDPTAAEESQVAVRLDYRPDGILSGYQIRTVSNALGPPVGVIDAAHPHGELSIDRAAAQLDRVDLQPTGVGSTLPLRDPWEPAPVTATRPAADGH